MSEETTESTTNLGDLIRILHENYAQNDALIKQQEELESRIRTLGIEQLSKDFDTLDIPLQNALSWLGHALTDFPDSPDYMRRYLVLTDGRKYPFAHLPTAGVERAHALLGAVHVLLKILCEDVLVIPSDYKEVSSWDTVDTE